MFQQARHRAMRPPAGGATLAACLLLALLLPAASAAQRRKAPPPQPEPEASEPTFFEVIDVRVVNVDVVVTDRKGRPVTGLVREDFELLEDGRPVQIDYFYAETEGAPAGEPLAAAAAEPSPEQRLHLALLVDDQSLTPPARNRLLPSLRRFLTAELRPGDRLLLARFEGGLTIEQPPVGDAAAIEAVVADFAKSGARGTLRRSDLSRILRAIQDAPLPSEGPAEVNDSAEMQAHALLGQIRAYGQERFEETRRTLSAVSSVVESLAGLPGRKAVLYVGAGFSVRPAEAVYRSFELKYGSFASRIGGSPFDGRQLDATSLVRDVAARANAGRVTLYALGAPEDIQGLGIEIGGMSWRDLDTPGGGLSWSSELAATEIFNLNQPLQMMTGPTGGIAAFDVPDPAGLLTTLRQDVFSYYSLGFVPARRDGKARRLEVKVKRDGLKVRHREAYREATGRERASRGTRSALLLGWSENPLEAALEMEGVTPEGNGQLILDLLVKVPMSKLVLLPQTEFHEGRLTLFLGARDAKGRASDLQEIAVPIRVPNDQLLTALGQTVAYRARMRLRPMEHVVAVGLRDELGNVESTVTTRFVPGEFQAAAPAGAGAPGGHGR